MLTLLLYFQIITLLLVVEQQDFKMREILVFINFCQSIPVTVFNDCSIGMRKTVFSNGVRESQPAAGTPCATPALRWISLSIASPAASELMLPVSVEIKLWNSN